MYTSLACALTHKFCFLSSSVTLSRSITHASFVCVPESLKDWDICTAKRGGLSKLWRFETRKVEAVYTIKENILKKNQIMSGKQVMYTLLSKFVP